MKPFRILDTFFFLILIFLQISCATVHWVEIKGGESLQTWRWGGQGSNWLYQFRPSFLPHTNRNNLGKMHAGGYSAVMDMCKYFNNIQTNLEDHLFLGLIHPITSALYTYHHGLPMRLSSSSGSSTIAASWVKSVFLCQLRQKFSIFSGVGTTNCFQSSFKLNTSYVMHFLNSIWVIP